MSFDYLMHNVSHAFYYIYELETHFKFIKFDALKLLNQLTAKISERFSVFLKFEKKKR